jgi:N-glycosidase YbiA
MPIISKGHALARALPTMPTVPDDNRILYFTRDREAFRFLSHFWPAAIDLDGATWPTVEHYYQTQKSDNFAYREAIRAAVTPGQAKRLSAAPDARGKAGTQSWFRAHGKQPRADWYDVKLDIMRKADWAKFSQHSELAALLIATGDAALIEDSPTDPFWGTGRDGNGENWAGRVLMEIRARLGD